MIFTGIGSRDTPEWIMDLERKIATRLAQKGWTLRSGGADGSDTAFEEGFIFGGSRDMEIYLPWKGFNGRPKNDSRYICDLRMYAYEVAARVHPKWEACSYYAKKLHARNVQQILGRNLDAPSDVVICYTLDGKLRGGTRTALVLAQENSIPIFNLGDSKWAEKSVEYIVSEITRASSPQPCEG